MAEVKERPIIFSGLMVRAILEGRKTQTRRVLKCIPEWVVRVTSINDDLFQVWNTAGDGMNFRRSPYGRPGDHLWVRETWLEANGKLFYAATEFDGFASWKPSIHMPRWASRITLEIAGVRVERLADITDDDAHAEGVPPRCLPDFGNTWATHRQGFIFEWDAINAKRGYSWESNPFVWVLSFKVITPANSAMHATSLRVASAGA